MKDKLIVVFSYFLFMNLFFFGGSYVICSIGGTCTNYIGFWKLNIFYITEFLFMLVCLLGVFFGKIKDN